MRYWKELHLSKAPNWAIMWFQMNCLGERGGSVVECRTSEREVGGSIPTAAVLCPWARHFTPRKYCLITQEAVAPSRHDWKIVDRDVKPQHKQTNKDELFEHSSPKLSLVLYIVHWIKLELRALIFSFLLSHEIRRQTLLHYLLFD